MQNIELHYCTKVQYKSLVECNPYIDKLIFFDDDLGTFIRRLKQENYDYIVDLHKNIRSFIIKYRLGVKSSSYNKLWIQRFLFTKFQIDFMPNCHVVDRYMDAVKELGVENDGEGLDYIIPQYESVSVNTLPEDFRSGYVVYVIGGSGFTKLLPFEKMVELCDKINRPIVLIGGEEDYEAGKKLEDFFNVPLSDKSIEEGLKKLNKRTIIYNGCGRYSIGESASIVKQADFIFGHDTGLTHLAAAFRKTIFSIWGGTVPNNFYSYGTKFYLLENTRLKCRPCSKSGRKKCPKRHFKCMKENPLHFSLPDEKYLPTE